MQLSQLSETRYVKIEGTHVSAAVDSAEEAKAAVKELRHKKREFAHRKRLLLRQRKAAQAHANRAKKSGRKRKGGMFSTLRAAFDMLSGLSGAFSRAGTVMDLPRIERECRDTDEILHNIETVLLQLQGKLLH